jgi:hypothetical protein
MRTLILVLLLPCFLLMPQVSWGISITLAWDPPERGIPEGYRMFYRFDGQGVRLPSSRLAASGIDLHNQVPSGHENRVFLPGL